MKKSLNITSFALGIAAALTAFFLLQKIFSKHKEKTQTDFFIITNQIKKMNKMVVMEQDFTSMQKTRMTSELLGGVLPPSEKEIITFTKTNAQVLYDLNKMKIDVDSVGKKLTIRELPEPEIRIIPSVEIQSMDDSFFNRFTEKDMHKITEAAKSNAITAVNQQKLITEGRKQLNENLKQIFVLAKALNYEIVDKTNQIETTKL